MQKIAGLMVHLLTASTAFIGLLTLVKIQQHQYISAFWLMGLAVLIDGVDGSFARLVNVKETIPNIDGTLLDNIVDYLNYVITPCFFLVVNESSLYEPIKWYLLAAITITSAYQFTQADAKTPDHFFKGFPCYWNIVVFYMFLFDTSAITNSLILALLCVMIFIPIKYVYPSRLDYLTTSKTLKIVMHCCSVTYGVSTAIILWSYPSTPKIWIILSAGYIALYLFLSILRTWFPLIKAKFNRNA
jgi:phosphatidylcholine synthase